MVPFSDLEKEGLVCLIGMAKDGPVRQPFLLKEETDVFLFLGQNQLSLAYQQLEEAGISRNQIVIYRMNGIHGQVDLKNETDTFFRFKTIGASASDRQLSIRTGKGTLSLIARQRLSDEEEVVQTRTFVLGEYPYLKDLEDAINYEAELGLTEIVAFAPNNLPTHTCFNESVEYFFLNSDPEDDCLLTSQTILKNHKERYWEKFEESFLVDKTLTFEPTLFELRAEALLFTDIYFDTFPEVAVLASKFAEQSTALHGRASYAIFNTSPIPKEQVIEPWYYQDEKGHWVTENGTLVIQPGQEKKAYTDQLLSTSLLLNRTDSALEHLQVVVGDFPFEEEALPLAPYYVATFLQTPTTLPVTNKAMQNIYFGETLSRKSIDILTDNGYICCVQSIRRNSVAYRAQSFRKKQPKSVFHSLHAHRTVLEINRTIKEKLETLIGVNNNEYQASSVHFFLKELLQNYQQKGVLQQFEIKLPTEVQGTNPLVITIDYILYQELQKISAGFSIEDRKGVTRIWKPND